jgi:hypothetical protein
MKASPNSGHPVMIMRKACLNFGDGIRMMRKGCWNFCEAFRMIQKVSRKLKEPISMKVAFRCKRSRCFILLPRRTGVKKRFRRGSLRNLCILISLRCKIASVKDIDKTIEQYIHRTINLLISPTSLLSPAEYYNPAGHALR